MTHVWIVTAGEDCEGGHIVSVHAGKRDAIIAAQRETERDGWTWTRESELKWRCHCDWVAVRRWDVK
jgi:hypothetical protein